MKYLVCALALAGCKDDEVDATNFPKLVDANNYNFTGELVIGSDQVTAYADATIDWSALTADFMGHDLDPALDIDQLSLVVFRYLSQEEVMEALSTDSLVQSDISLYMQHFNTDEDTSCLVSEFSLFGNDIDIEEYFTESYGTWALLLGQGSIPGQGTLMMSFVEPLIDGTETEVVITNESTELIFDVDLGSLESVAVLADTEIAVDWSKVTKDGRGNDIDLSGVDELWVAHYPDASAADLETNFFDLELMTDELWTADASGITEFSLADMDGSTTLSGLSTGGTWLLALRCGACFNPAPPFLTVLDVQ